MQRFSRWFNGGLFGSYLVEQFSDDEPLIRLHNSIDWNNLSYRIGKFYDPEIGRPSIDLKLIMSIIMLQNIYNLSDEAVIENWSRNVAFQAFSGANYFTLDRPFHPSTLTKFRQRIGKEGLEIIFAQTVLIHPHDCLEKEVIIDTTVQPKYTSYPNDTKLRLDVINQIWAMGVHLDISFDINYSDRVSELKKIINFTKATKNKTKLIEKDSAISELKDIANYLIDQLEVKAHPITKLDPIFINSMSNYRKAVNQKKDDKRKIYSIYEPHIACIAKGKAHKKFEFGNKVSIAIGADQKIILGVASFIGTPYDGDTVEDTLKMMKRVFNGYAPEVLIADLGYRGRPMVLDTKVITPVDYRNATNPSEKETILVQLSKRSTIEPIIGHLKSDHGLARNRLHGVLGDHINALCSAIGFNLRKFLHKQGAQTIEAIRYVVNKKSKTRKVPFVRPDIKSHRLFPLTA
jgi:IS5 family transposase